MRANEMITCLRECMEISLQNVYVEIGTFKGVKRSLDLLQVDHLVSGASGFVREAADRERRSPTKDFFESLRDHLQ